jgi:hypothetical protein
VSRNRFTVGEEIHVRVEIVNGTDEDFFVGRSLQQTFTNPSYVWITVSDELTGSGSDKEATTEFLTPRTVSEWWTRVAPRHFYGTELSLDGRTHAYLRKRGHYLVRAKYISRGGIVAATPNEGSPSQQVWQGEIESNTISIEIV